MGNHLQHPITSKVVETDGNLHYRVAVAAMNGFRECMEDAHCIQCTSDYGLFGVFDGHSGSQCSAFCSSELPKLIKKKKLPLSDEDLVDITLQMDANFQEQCKESGCTACYFLSIPNQDGTFQVQVANVGDSRIIIGRNGGAECVPMTEDHKPSVPAEHERIVRCGGRVEMDRVDGMLAMSRAMGDREYKQGPGGPLEQKVIAKPDVTRATCTPADWVLVACDGVFESEFSNEEVVVFVKTMMEQTENDIAKVVCAVCDEALKRGSTDNITCMLVQFQDGTGFKFPKPLFIPGPFSNKGNFVQAYKGMAERAGLTLGQALEIRYDMIRDQMSQRIVALKAEANLQGQDEELKALQEELTYFKPGPMKLQGTARTQWFEKLASSSTSNGEGDGMQLDVETIQRLKQVLAGGRNNAGELGQLFKATGAEGAAQTNHQEASSSPPPKKGKQKGAKGK